MDSAARTTSIDSGRMEFYALSEASDTDINEALNATWQDGLLQIETFYGGRGIGARVNSGVAGVGRGDSGTWSEAIRDVLVADSESKQASTVAGDAGQHATPPEEPVAPAPEHVEGALGTGADESGVHEATDDSLSGFGDRMEVDHVTLRPSNDATDAAPPAQPHFTDQRGRDAEKEETENSNPDHGVRVGARPRADSMNISFIINREPEQKPSEPTTEGGKDVEQQLKEDQPAALPEESSLPHHNSSPALPIRPASAERSNPLTPHQLPHTTTDTMTPGKPTNSAEPPSSAGKGSLMHEMRKEDEHAFPNPRRSSVGTGKEESPATEEDDDFMDALSSPVGLTVRLREVQGEEDRGERGDGDGDEDGEVVGEGNVVGGEDVQEKDEEMTEVVDEVEAAGARAQGKDAIAHAVEIPAAAAVVEKSEGRDAKDVTGKDDGGAKDMPDAAKKGGLAAKERRKAYVEVPDDTALDPEAADRAGDVTMEDVRPDLEPEPTTKNKKGSRARKSTAATVPQTRTTRHSSVAAVEAATTNDMSPTSNILVKTKMMPKDRLDKKDEMSEDELASSSPQTVSRKRKASSPHKQPTATKLTRGAKKKKAGTATDTTKPNEPVADTTQPSPDPKKSDTTTSTLHTITHPTNPTKKRKTRAEIREAKRPKAPRNPQVRGGVGVHELRDMTDTFLSAEGGGGGDETAGVGAGGRRKTRAQMEKEEVQRTRAPDAGSAVRARREGR